MDASIATPEAVAAYLGIDWADQKHAIALRSAAEPSKIEHQLIDQKPEALMEEIGHIPFSDHNLPIGGFGVRRLVGSCELPVR